MKKPLYSITSGELGTEIEQTDSELRNIFTRAKAWDAIILLDEADVFLAQRTATDLKRNAYVSGRPSESLYMPEMFLRLIEYHQGTMFLTTNRLEDFDKAFESRIHLTIRYDALDSIRRTNIWRNFLRKIGSGHWDEATLSRLGTE
jgi:AAA+ superfamily predicted ATPase